MSYSQFSQSKKIDNISQMDSGTSQSGDLTRLTTAEASGVSTSFNQVGNKSQFTAAEATHSIKEAWIEKITEEATTRKMSGLVGTNLLLLTDSYKVSHKKQYPFGNREGTRDNEGIVYSYFESRGAGAGGHEEIVFFGLQYFIKRYLEGVVVTTEKIEEAAEYYAGHFGSDEIFDKQAWEYIVSNHGGKLPVKIMAVPEGTVLTVKNVLFTLENTDPKCYWLTNFLETLLVQVWYPMTVASNSRAQKKVILSALKKSGTPLSTDADGKPVYDIDFKLHDFGCRGVSSPETAGIGAMAHLTQFNGTDTVPGLVFAKEYYGATPGETDKTALGYVKAGWGMTIPASEHSTMTSWGDQPSDEFAAYNNMLTVYPKGPVACVIDAYNMYLAAEFVIGEALTDSLEKREDVNDFVKKKFVIRPDSGTPMFSDDKLLDVLWEKFKGKNKGYNDKKYKVGKHQKNSKRKKKRFKVLRDDIRIIQGDGIDYQAIIDILRYLMDIKGWSADNIGFGSGGGLLQKLNRDTQKCAFKASFISDTKGERMVYKEPIDAPFKKSKQGRLILTKNDGKWVTKTKQKEDDVKEDDVKKNEMKCVFENGVNTKIYNFKEIVELSKITNIEDWDRKYRDYDKIVAKVGAIQKKNVNVEKEGMLERLETDVKKYQTDEGLLEKIQTAQAIRLAREKKLDDAMLERMLEHLETDVKKEKIQTAQAIQLARGKKLDDAMLKRIKKRLETDVKKYQKDEGLLEKIQTAQASLDQAIRLAREKGYSIVKEVKNMVTAAEWNTAVWDNEKYVVKLEDAAEIIRNNIKAGIF